MCNLTRALGLPRLVVRAVALGEFDLIAVGVVGGHGALPGRVVGRLVDGDAARLQLRVERVEVVGGELDVYRAARVERGVVQARAQQAEGDLAQAQQGEGRAALFHGKAYQIAVEGDGVRRQIK